MPEESIIPTMPTLADAYAYAADAGQRSILFLDVMRQRGAQYEEHTARTAPHVLVLRGPARVSRPCGPPQALSGLLGKSSAQVGKMWHPETCWYGASHLHTGA